MRITPEQLQSKMARWARVAPQHLRKTLIECALLVENEAIRKHLSGPKMPRGVGSTTNATLARQTGRLARSITHKVTVSGTEVSAQVGTNLKYAAMHEFGGTIRAKNSPYLRFQYAPGKWASKKEVRVPARPFLRPSVDTQKSRIADKILAGYLEAYDYGE